MSNKTVKCRIALAVLPEGSWNAVGWGSSNKDYEPNDEEKMEACLDPLDATPTCYWVEIEVPLPNAEVPTLQATAQPAGAAK